MERQKDEAERERKEGTQIGARKGRENSRATIGTVMGELRRYVHQRNMGLLVGGET